MLLCGPVWHDGPSPPMLDPCTHTRVQDGTSAHLAGRSPTQDTPRIAPPGWPPDRCTHPVGRPRMRPMHGDGPCVQCVAWRCVLVHVALRAWPCVHGPPCMMWLRAACMMAPSAWLRAWLRVAGWPALCSVRPTGPHGCVCGSLRGPVSCKMADVYVSPVCTHGAE